MVKTIALCGLAVYFGILLYLVARGKKGENTLDFFFGGRTIPFWALSITFMAAWWGAGSALSTADLAYEDGMGAFWYYGVPVLFSNFLMIIGARAIRRVGYLTQGKMMEARYSKLTSYILSILIFLFMTFNAAAQMVGVGDFFGTYLGLNYEVAVLVGTLIVIVYATMGGFRGVVLTDLVQFLLLVFAAFAVFVVGLSNAGGFSNIAAIAQKAGKPQYMSVLAGMKKYFVYVITFGGAWMIQANVWQIISATKNDTDARKMTVTSFFAYIPLYLIVVFTGMSGIALYKTLPQGGVVIAIVQDYMNPLLASIVFIGISAAIMSTMDSLINTGAMTLAIDFQFKQRTEKEQVKYSRIATLIVTAIGLIIAMKIRSILVTCWIAADIITTGMFIPLIVGFFWRRGNSYGANASMVWGLCFSTYNFIISFGVKLPSFWEPQSAYQDIIGISVSAIFYIVASLLTKPEYEKADKFIALAGFYKKR